VYNIEEMINTPSKKVINFNVLDIFCGAGGLSLGLEKAGFKTLIGVDFNSEALKTFKNNFPMSEIICGDITKNDVKRKIFDLAKNKMINMIVGGPPCQGFSLKGKKLGLDDPRNFLFKEYLEIVKELKPIVFVIENVKNILSSSNGYFKNKILTEIKKLGYVVNYGVLNAANYAVPQNRERSFFIASKEKVISFPDEIKKKVTVRDAISDLSYLNSGEGKILSKYKNGAKSNYQIKLRSTRLQYHISSNHSDVALKKLKLIPPEKGKEYLPKHMIGKQKFLTT
jgi:DNA (cytosine-5)-methyltransferase 1/site-specific DNA-methyltransferase (adenine-specific)